MAAVETAREHCPSCSARVAEDQEYCLECGARLPAGDGVVPLLAQAWRRRWRRYPGDWVWSALVLLAVAAVGAAAAIAATDEGARRARPLVATSDRPVAAPPPRQATATPAPSERRARRPSVPKRRQTTLVQWPFGRSAYTVVLASFPAPAEQEKATRLGRRALRAGLPDVGVLDSSRFPSLHPGYYVVFSGVYESADDAASALAQAQRLGYRRAYTRQIVS